MALAGIYNFVIEQGVTFDRPITYYQADGTTPVDLTGFTAKMQARSAPNSSIKLLDLTTENGGLELGGTSGTVRIIVDDSKTSLLDFSTAEYDIFLMPNGGEPEKFLKGQITLDRRITQ